MFWALISWIHEYFERTNLTNIVTTMSVKVPRMHILRPLFPLCKETKKVKIFAFIMIMLPDTIIFCLNLPLGM